MAYKKAKTEGTAAAAVTGVELLVPLLQQEQQRKSLKLMEQIDQQARTAVAADWLQ